MKNSHFDRTLPYLVHYFFISVFELVHRSSTPRRWSFRPLMFRRQRHHSIRSASVWAPSSPPPPHLAPTIRTNRTAAHVVLPPLPHPHPHCLPAADRGSSFAGPTSCMTASTGARWQRQLMPRETVTTSPGRPQSTKTCNRHHSLLLSTRGQDPMLTISPTQGKN